MKALRYHARRDFRLEEVEPAPLGDNDVRVRVEVCGICGSDVHEYVAGFHGVPTGKPHPRTGRMAPLTGGHEFAGVVAEVGPQVRGFALRDRVAVRPTMPCYECSSCRRGRYSQCLTLATIGVSADGAFAESVVVRHDCLHAMPDHLGFEAASYAEPLACGLHAIARCGLEPGASVAVVGAGPIGLMVVQAALNCGASAVVVLEPSAARRERALGVGATAVVDAADAGAAKQVAALTRGQRADVTFECSGVADGLLLADAATGRGGVIVGMGLLNEQVAFPFLNAFLREKRIVGSMGYDNADYATALDFIASGRVRTAELTTARIRLDEVMDRGFAELTGPQRHQHCKILVSPG
jgi:(R,R)-butanediol dehydrogenase/meso-butanediol dehydrogenase/diacetyl reductase